MHEVETLMSAEVPWHGIGNIVDGDVLSEQAITLSSLDWDVGTAPVHTLLQDAEGEEYWQEVPGTKAVIRLTDLNILGTVGDRYVPLQNREAFSFMDSIAADGLMRYHSAGSLRGGKIVFLSAVIPGAMKIAKGVELDKYLLMINSFDASRPVTVFPTSVNVVCMNTLRAAVSGKSRKSTTPGITVRHTRNLSARLVEAASIFKTSSDALDTLAEAGRYLVSVKMTTDKMDNFLETVFPSRGEDEKTGLPLYSSQTTFKRETVLGLFETGRGMENKYIRGTAWAALQAVTEFTSHEQVIRAQDDALEARVESSWFGAGDKLNQLALGALLALD